MGSRVLSRGMGLSYRTNLERTKSPGRFLAATLLVISGIAVARADLSSPNLAKVFPADLGAFHQIEPARQITPADKNPQRQDYSSFFGFNRPLPVLVAEAKYALPDGEKLIVAVTKWENDSTAYSNLTAYRKYFAGQGQGSEAQPGNVGTASWLLSAQTLAFFKGPAFVVVTTENGRNSDRVSALGRAFADTLDPGEDDIPVLVKHLPNSGTAQRDALYIVTSDTLLNSVPNQPILKEVTFEGGTEAVIASYGQSQIVIAEFTTPQFSVDCDQRIWTRIAELKSQGQPTPIAYRRIGNYSVFVFNSPDEKTANDLVDQVKYEQIVQWLGDDPHMADRLQRYFSRTTAGVLLTVLKTSGLSLLVCLGAGAMLGTLLFRHRRARQAAFYSDAGGSTRLNLDEMTGASNSQRLLGPGKQTESDS